MTAPTADDLYELGRVELLLRQRRLVARDGDVSDTMLRASAAMGDAIIGWTAGEVRGCFLSTSRGSRLTTVARDRGVERREAVAAVGAITLTRSTSAVARIVPAGTRIATQPDADGAFVTVTLDTPLSFGIGVTVQTGNATAIAGGRAGNVAIDTLTRVLDTLAETFTATNAARFVRGEEAEADEDLRDRAQGLWQTAARGTEKALIQGAREAGAYTASVTRDASTNVITVYIADREGNSNAALEAAAAAELAANWQGAADVVNVTGGIKDDQAIDVSLTVRSGVAIPPLVAFVRAAIVAAVNRLRINETLYRSLIATAARSVSPDILECVVNTPAANVAPLAGHVIRTTSETVTVS